MAKELTTRRRFLVATIAGSGVAACGLNLSLLRDASAWAEASEISSSGTAESLAGMVRLYYPHDNVADDVYMQTVDSIFSAAASD
jgi:hypothetical protein